MPADSITTPRAWPTLNAVRAFWPKNRSSIATAVGECSLIRSHTRAWIVVRRFSSGWCGLVSITPPSSAASRCPRA